MAQEVQAVRDLAAMHDASVAALRRALPLGQYLSLLHAGATTGFLPVIDPATGRFREQNPMNADGSLTADGERGFLDPKTRMEALRFLVNKSMPDPKSETLEAPRPTLANRVELDELRAMTNDELLQLAHDAASEADRR